MRIAIVVPWYFANGGAERVDAVLGNVFPDADFFALFHKPCGIPAELVGRTIRSSFLQRIPMIEKCYRPLLPLFPYAVESFDLRGYDLVISSDWAIVKGVLTGMDTLHVCYCHSPMQHIWNRYRGYLYELSGWQQPFYAAVTKLLRDFDFSGSQRVDAYAANSKYIAKRINHYYRRTAEVIYPPVDTSKGYISRCPSDYYLSVGRLNRTKRLDLLIHACNRIGRKLVISGWGPEERALKSIAGPTVEFVGRLPEQDLPKMYANCRALLFAADEDFGIVPIEAQSYGRPVIAYGHGGSLETVLNDDPSGRADTGVFFSEQSVESMIDGIRRFEHCEDKFDPPHIRRHAQCFDTLTFKTRFKAFLDAALSKSANAKAA